jgi:hypothetical protein
MDHILKITAVLCSTDPDPDVAGSSCRLEIDKLPNRQVAPLVVKGQALRSTLSDQGRSASTQDLKSRLEGALARTVVRTVRAYHAACGSVLAVRRTC